MSWFFATGCDICGRLVFDPETRCADCYGWSAMEFAKAFARMVLRQDFARMHRPDLYEFFDAR